jgi:hypothetical protein
MGIRDMEKDRKGIGPFYDHMWVSGMMPRGYEWVGQERRY